MNTKEKSKQKLKKNIDKNIKCKSNSHLNKENQNSISMKSCVVLSQNESNIWEEEKKNKNDTKASKRQAGSPLNGTNQKRSALGNISNVVHRSSVVISKDVISKQASKEKENATVRRRSLRLQAKLYLTKPLACVDNKANSFNKADNLNASLNSSQENKSSKEDNDIKDNIEPSPIPSFYYEHKASPKRSRLDYFDYDALHVNNIAEAPEYAFTVFEYMRARESQFPIKAGYLAESQLDLTPDMRAILVDWMVEVQENFELNHETLYLAVKLVDHYLQEVRVSRQKLQLVGATALLIAAKFDERHPPYIDDFLYICDDAYNRNDVLSTERAILIRIGFDINIPISYRFLRRYAKCLRASMETLTLARFILELTLQCYQFVDRSASQLGAAALWLALKMKKSDQTWDDTLLYYTNRTEEDVVELAFEMNAMIVESKSKKLKTIWHKYSHSIFYEVAKTPPLNAECLSTERSRVYALNDSHESGSKTYAVL